MTHQIALDPDSRSDVAQDDGTQQVTTDLAFRSTLFVNVAFCGLPHAASGDWVLIDAGLQGGAAVLVPESVLPGHGQAMRGEAMQNALHPLARDFDIAAVPRNGYYVAHPGRPEDGSAYPPARS